MSVSSRAQAAMEYLLVIALVTTLLIPASYIFYRYAQSSSERLKIGQIEKMGNDIVDAAETIYYLGAPSRQDLSEHMPEGVYNITIFNNWGVEPRVNELVFYTRFGGKPSEKVFFSRVNINGSFSKRDWAPGAKVIRVEAIEAKPPYVNISFVR